jgi:mRNA-degrading endonuclease toxin of MazEF toxin-antitoxin module
MTQECVLNLDDIQTISKALLTNRLTRLDAAKMDAVRDAIFYALAL